MGGHPDGRGLGLEGGISPGGRREAGGGLPGRCRGPGGGGLRRPSRAEWAEGH